MDEKNFDTTTIVHIAESLMSGTCNCLDERMSKGSAKATAFLFGERPQPKLRERSCFMIARDRLTGHFDDEERLLNGLRRQLRGEFEIVTAVGGEQALEILRARASCCYYQRYAHARSERR